jgi:hypothetical protein
MKRRLRTSLTALCVSWSDYKECAAVTQFQHPEVVPRERRSGFVWKFRSGMTPKAGQGSTKAIQNPYKAGASWGCISAVDSQGRTIFVADAHRDGQRFIVRAKKLTAFLELETAIRVCGELR